MKLAYFWVFKASFAASMPIVWHYESDNAIMNFRGGQEIRYGFSGRGLGVVPGAKLFLGPFEPIGARFI